MTLTGVPTAPRRQRASAAWIHGPSLDLFLALCWVPFAIAGLALQGSGDRLQWYASAVLLLSLAHQPITLAMVYGDAEQFALKRRVFTWTPVVLATLVFVGLRIDFLLVAVIGGLWNTEHTLMQRYGIVRIYRRKGGETGSGRLDLMLLSSWLVLVLAWAVADPRTSDRIESLGLGTANRRSLQLLLDVRPYATVLLVIAFVFSVVTTGRWLVREAAGGFGSNPATYGYLLGTAGLFLLAAFHPVAGLLAWVGSHAVEYFIVVVTNMGRRYPADQSPTGPLAKAVRTPIGVIGFVAVFSAAVVLAVLYLQNNASLTLYGMVFFCLGGMHIFYDGFIWKLRRPKVAESFAIDT